MIAVAFLPVLVLEGQEGKLFRPLAYTKNFAMLVAAVLALTLDPVLRLAAGAHAARPVGARAGLAGRAFNGLLNARVHPEEKHPITGPLMRVYDPVVRWTLRWKTQVIAGGGVARCGLGAAVLEARLGVHAAAGGGLDPVHAHDHAGHLDRRIAAPAAGDGRHPAALPRGGLTCWERQAARTRATDPAPLSMLETVIVLKPAIAVAASAHVVLVVGA